MEGNEEKRRTILVETPYRKLVPFLFGCDSGITRRISTWTEAGKIVGENTGRGKVD